MVKDAVPLGDCRRALVIKLRHHGDVLLAAPVLSVLKARAPQMEVDALVYDDTAPMLEGHPALAQLHVGRPGLAARSGCAVSGFGRRSSLCRQPARAPLRPARASYRAAARRMAGALARRAL